LCDDSASVHLGSPGVKKAIGHLNGSRRRKAAAPALVLALFFSCRPAFAADCDALPAPGVNWQNCQKRIIMLQGSDLSGANLAGADFTSTDLRDTNLQGANLEKATLVRTSFSGANAQGANFTRVQGYRTDFSGMNGKGAPFVFAELQRSNFKGANLEGADFEKAELGRAQFDDAVITGTNFLLANLARADLTSAKFTGPIDFTNAFMFLTRIAGVDLSAATGLQQWQIDMACGDEQTRLPDGLKASADWPCPPDD
jgi:uncharacterized protein YjbI with pentapeptide repeats